MKSGFQNREGKIIVDKLIKMIHENRVYLGELDGAIGDGDHGINMDKGFSMVEKEVEGKDLTMSEALKILGNTLLEKIGGSMGPLYGTMFRSMARASKNYEIINTEVFSKMIVSAKDAVCSIGEARAGDKTMIDTLEPASASLILSVESEADLNSAVNSMLISAETGWKSTEDMVAKVGRAARLGERSRGALDAGATSCFLILESMGTTVKELLS